MKMFNGLQRYAKNIHENGITSVESDQEIPVEYDLAQNYPNPFNPTTTINFSIPKTSEVSLIVYSITGEKVAEVVNNLMPAGKHSVKFDASRLSSGVYIYNITAGDFVQSRKMMLIK
ncbi:MAG: T9SS type A sorting domain-containing protein [Melioribacteraceae bacterium]|nr:T9SS type A sorting domain-containing protein [Melioribacteraceae bacterium]